MAVRHRCFVSHHAVNSIAVRRFIDEFADVFIGSSVGVSDADDFINSSDQDYVMRRIREKYLTNTTVTIVLIGDCTKARKYVDWEIASSLRNDPNNGRSGLLGINLKSLGKRNAAPPRLASNWNPDSKDSYAEYYVYPGSKATLRSWIQGAFDRRWRTPDNSLALFKNNRRCP